MSRNRFGRSNFRIKKMLRRSRPLRRRLSKKQRKYLQSTLNPHRRGGGISKRELRLATRKMKKIGDDPINRGEANFIKAELGEYLGNLSKHPNRPYASRSFFRRGYESNNSNNSYSQNNRSDSLSEIRNTEGPSTADRFSRTNDDFDTFDNTPSIPKDDYEAPENDSNIVYPDIAT